MALDHHKWDAQIGDAQALAGYPLLLSRAAWRELAALAEALARETGQMEDELARRPELHPRLGVPRALATVLAANASCEGRPAAPRIQRFDFHPTRDGWRLSEVNSDVPGGFTESSRFAALVAEATGEGAVPGDAAAAWCESIARAAGPGGQVALLSAPGWVEDAQVVAHLAARLRATGLRVHLAQPRHLRWAGGRASMDSDFARGELDAVVRFYQAEWMASLPCRASWAPLLAGARTVVTNPGCAALTESKRLPLVWGDLDAPHATWRSVLPQTLDPRDAPDVLRGDWVLKPAYGNTGDDVAMRSATSCAGWTRRVLGALVRPRHWVAQRRFEVERVDTPAGPVAACIGVYVVDGRATGVYGRVTRGPVIDWSATDVAVLVEDGG